MPIVGLSFNKIVVEKLSPIKGRVQVNNNVVLKDVEKTDMPSGQAKQGAIKFHFDFAASYDAVPEEGQAKDKAVKHAIMTMNGFLTFLDSAEKITELIAEWKKDKKIPKDIMSSVLNTVLSRCNVEALFLARELNLPPPIPLPKVQVK